MKTLSLFLTVAGMLFSVASRAQVDEIKRASAEHAGDKKKNDSGSSVGAAFVSIDLLEAAVLAIAGWQELKLQKKEVNPTIVSFDVMLQGALQPSSYYILHPRVRANWGLFSTDFRFNYLIEESIEGTKHIRTNDWQILQLNIVTTRNVIARVGGGILREAFNDGKQFSEWSVGMHFRSNTGVLGAMTEYRWSEPRHEWNGQVQYLLFQHKASNVYFTAGAVYQRYYKQISVWGMQGGLMLRFF